MDGQSTVDKTKLHILRLNTTSGENYLDNHCNFQSNPSTGTHKKKLRWQIQISSLDNKLHRCMQQWRHSDIKKHVFVSTYVKEINESWVGWQTFCLRKHSFCLISCQFHTPKYISKSTSPRGNIYTPWPVEWRQLPSTNPKQTLSLSIICHSSKANKSPKRREGGGVGSRSIESINILISERTTRGARKTYDSR